jgi:hypothetical protein
MEVLVESILKMLNEGWELSFTFTGSLLEIRGQKDERTTFISLQREVTRTAPYINETFTEGSVRDALLTLMNWSIHRKSNRQAEDEKVEF